MKSLKHIWFYALKDLKLFSTDRMALLFAILFPFLFIVLFNFLLSDVGGEDERRAFHLVTQETAGGLSHQIIAAIETRDESQLKPGEPIFIWLDDYARARQMVEEKELAGFIAFPTDFTEGVMTGSGTQLEVVADAEDINTRAALNGLALAISSQVGSHAVTASATIELMIEQGLIAPGDRAAIEQVVQQLFSTQEGITAGEIRNVCKTRRKNKK